MTTKPLAAVVGANCRRIRTDAGVTQDELARAARRLGLKWTASKVRDFESGRTAPTFATVMAVTAALDSVTKPIVKPVTSEQGNEIAIEHVPVRLADLVSFEGAVAITEDFEPTGEMLAEYCGGGTWQQATSAVGSVLDWPGLTEERIAAALGISADQLHDVSLRLWNTTFGAHRDRIAGPEANAQHKGRITRQLKAELEKALTDGDD